MWTTPVTPSSIPDTTRVADLDWIRSPSWPAVPRRDRPLYLVDLFCGCGGLSLGAWEGARTMGRNLGIRLAIDVNPHPIEVYRHNFGLPPEVAVHGPVEALFERDLGAPPSPNENAVRDRVGQTDLLVAGPPCQGHSDLNNSTRRKDPRNKLYLRVVRAVEVLKPRAVIIENVPTVTRDHDAVIKEARALLERGYAVSEAVARIDRHGIAQRRRRHLLVAVAAYGAFDVERFLDSLPHVNATLGDYLNGLEDEPSEKTGAFYETTKMTRTNAERVDYLFENDEHDLPNHLRPRCHNDSEHSYVSMYGRMHSDRPAQTITSGFGSMGQGRYVHPTRRRMITAHEAARIQGFPDFYDFSLVNLKTALREMIGNAVPPRLTALLTHELCARQLV